MYSNRYERSKPNPISLTAAIGINAALVGALLFSSPTITEIIDPPLMTYPVHDDLPPPPRPPEPIKETRVATTPHEPLIVTPIPKVETVTVERPSVSTTDVIALRPLDPGPPSTGTGVGPVTLDPPKPVPVIVGATPDPRATFQPDYPPSERRAGAEGAVTVRVLVGTDGRVKAVERVEAASDAFFEATRRQALDRWRFRPATRDGVPYETWRTMTVRFVLEG